MKKTFRRERICRNRNCLKTFTPEKSEKRVHCCDACKEEHNSNKRSLRDSLINKWIKGYKNNYNILRLYEHLQSVPLSIKELVNLNFNLDCLPNMQQDDIGVYYSFGYLKLYYAVGPTDYLLIVQK